MNAHPSIDYSSECREIRLWQAVYPSKVVRIGLYHQSMAARAVPDDGRIRLQNETLTGKRYATVLLRRAAYTEKAFASELQEQTFPEIRNFRNFESFEF